MGEPSHRIKTVANARSKPPSRRKSCGECSKAKRRCDQQLPACSRCTKLRFKCYYASSATPQDIISSDPPGSFNLNSAGLLEPIRSESYDLALSADSMLVDGLDLEFLAGDGNDIFSVGDPLLQTNFTEQDDLLPLARSEISYIEQLTPEEILSATASRVSYAVEVFKNAPSRMVLENGIAWSHPLLYKDYMPKSMSDAHAACALYMAKNDRNKSLIFRSIETRAKELLSSPKNLAPVEKLARVQSLLLYQIIMIYDGDIRLRSLGEATMGDLDQYARSLCSILDNLHMNQSLLTPESPEPPVYLTWIFQESCRRTFLVAYYFISVYGMLKGKGCYDCPYNGHYPWTISAPVWESLTEFDFKIAWKGKKRYIIQDIDFEEVLRDGRPEEIDEFGKMFLVGARGLDDAREWFYDRGGELLCPKQSTPSELLQH